MKRRNFIASLLGIPAIGVAATKAEACHLCEDKKTPPSFTNFGQNKNLILRREDLSEQFKNISGDKVDMGCFKSKYPQRLFHEAPKVFFVDKKRIYGQVDEQVADDEDMPSGLSFTTDFEPDDMMSTIIGYMDTTMTNKAKLAFVTQLQSYVLNEIIDEESYNGGIV